MQTIIHYGKQFIQYVRNNQAIAALEYAVLVGVIGVAVAIAVANFGDDVTDAIKSMGEKVKTVESDAKDLID